MKLQISLFNKSIISSDLKRFWWVGALYGLILFFALPLQHLLQEFPLKEEWQKEALALSLQLTNNSAPYRSYSYLNQINTQVLLVCTVPIFLAILLFSYLHSTRAATMLHSLPLKRITLLGSHSAAGILIISAPVFFIAVIMALLATFTDLGMYYSVVNVLKWLCTTLLYNILFFSITVFVGMFTGNVIAHIVFTYAINILPYGLYMLAGCNLETLQNGFFAGSLSSEWTNILPLIKISGSAFRSFTILQGLIYLLAAFIILGAAGLAYKGRKLEAAGDIVAFRRIRPFFKYGATICLMLTGGFFTGYVNHSRTTDVIAAYFLCAFIGYWLSQGLLEKSIKIWYRYKGFLILNAVVIVMLAVILTDMTGYVKRIPQQNEIVSAYYGNSYTRWLSENNDYPEAKYSIEGLFIEDANIKAVTELHRQLMEYKNERGGERKYIVYELNDGRKMVRRYTVDEDALREYVKPMYESMEYKEDEYPVLNQDVRDIKFIEIKDKRSEKRPLILTDALQIQGFVDVLRHELINAGYDEVKVLNEEYAYIQITKRNDASRQYDLERSFKVLYSWLEENGYYDKVMLVPEDINHVTLEALDVRMSENGGYSYSDVGNGIKLKDIALIKELLDVCRPRLWIDTNSGDYFAVKFFSQAESKTPDFDGYIYPNTPMSEELRQKFSGLGR